MDISALVADGWQQLPTRAFSASIGPTFMKVGPDICQVALLTDEGSVNDHGAVVHGGVMMTFADIALGVAAVNSLGIAPGGKEQNIVTAQLTYQFAGRVIPGSLVICDSELVRRTKRLVFVRGLFKTGDETVGSAEGIFHIVGQKV